MNEITVFAVTAIIMGLLFNIVRVLLVYWKYKNNCKCFKTECPNEYEQYLKELLKKVKKGKLVKRMNKGEHFFFSQPSSGYKKYLGATYRKNIFGRIVAVYTVYEDFDGSIKYYEFPQ